ncbi:PREDICTED: protein O-linked-mannose beta-1,2-N-acetylglucosaminyltransferase 1-like [Acropora digitifera]|uniref:protein O-linked-mannose beta-1,2-N-acetylglucosaminyltransferase 1-like n=1 Tax=Acropora digitifera TaxID=70779 RepID=UPI00077A98CB|nr:PREDICTED: protein O-linked-mannose beta-1,2-N-acetylglucosaminyltransferase 1-like [Acropora digitifera]
MTGKRTQGGLSRRFIGRVLLVFSGIFALVNMLFVLQSTTELSRLASYVYQDETVAFSSEFNVGKERVVASPLKEGKFLELELYSSKDNVTLTINGKTRLERSELLLRGLNVIALNEVSGEVMSSRWFDTYAIKADSDNLMDYLRGLKDGRIICFAVRDEAAQQLTQEAKDHLTGYRSSFIKFLEFRSTWAFVVQKIKGNYVVFAESFQNPPKGNDWANPVRLRTMVRLLPENVVKCSWPDTVENRRRTEFCQIYEGYPDVCRCEDPVDIELKPPPFQDGRRLEIPIAVMASNRPHYLIRMLLGLQKVEGLDPNMVTVFIDGFWKEPESVTKLIGVKVQQHAGVSHENARIAQHYKKSLHDSFEEHPNANYLIILEEDLDVSADILSYFKQLLPVFENDESVYCISAWNDQGYNHLSNDPAMMYRVETMPGLGWVLSRKIFKNELEEKWPRPDQFIDWDIWTRGQEVRKSRECIIPDISRTFHFGGRGMNVGGNMQAMYFEKHAINKQVHVEMAVDKMYKDNYEKEIHKLLSQAETLDHNKTPCSNPQDFIPDTEGKLFVFYIKMMHSTDFETWMNIASCFHMWDLDARGFHKSMWRFWIKKNHILVIGCPSSEYCSHKPVNLEPIYIPKKPEVKQ